MVGRIRVLPRAIRAAHAARPVRRGRGAGAGATEEARRARPRALQVGMCPGCLYHATQLCDPNERYVTTYNSSAIHQTTHFHQ